MKSFTGKLHYRRSFAPDGNLGKAYNEDVSCDCIKSNDWVCLYDYDVAFVDFGIHDELIRYHIGNRKPDTGVLTCLTNRVGRREQCLDADISDNDSIRHWRKQTILVNDRPPTVSEIDKEVSGFLMIFEKATWEAVGGFMEREKRMLSIDNHFCWAVMKLGKKIYRMNNVFAFHYYRLAEGIHYKKHLL